MINNRYLLSIRHYFLDPKTRAISISSAVIALILILQGFISCQQSTSSAPSSPHYLSDHIPEGYFVVPLNLINIESLSPLMGSVGYADLYATESLHNRRQILVRNAKLLKTAENPLQVAAILTENQSQKLTNFDQAIFAVLRKRQKKGPSQLNPKKRTSITILPGAKL